VAKLKIDESSKSLGLSYLGFFFAAVVALGGLGGNWLDQRYHTSPLFVILGLALAMYAGIREMLKALKEITPIKTKYPTSASPGANPAVRSTGDNDCGPAEVDADRGASHAADDEDAD
jgi:hypothetical protein